MISLEALHMISVRKCFDKRVVRYAAALIAFLLLEGPMGVALAQGPQDFIVTFREGTIPAVRAASVGRAGASLRFNYTIVNAAAVRVPNDNALERLRNDPSVLSIIPDRPVFAFQQGNGKGGKKPPKDDGGGDPPPPASEVVPSGVKRVGEPTSGSTGAGVGVAIVDTGIDLAHPDLDVDVADSFFSAFGDTGQDDEGHGTHVAGIVAALDNDSDVIGVAPAAGLYSVKVLDSNGSGSDATIMAGLQWIADNHDKVDPPIRVANLSLGRPGTLGDNPTLRASFKALYDLGIAVVVAAGNDPYTEVRQQVPATYPEVMAVASTTATAGSNKCRRLSEVVAADTASYFTTDGEFIVVGNSGLGVTISAPGESHEDISKRCFLSPVGILSTQNGGGTTRKYGTSMASPHVAGIVARLIEKGVGSAGGWLGVEDIRNNLRGGLGATPLPAGMGTMPLDSLSGAYSFDGEREGIAQAPQ